MELCKGDRLILNWDKYLKGNYIPKMRERMNELISSDDLLVFGGNHATTAFVIAELLQKKDFPIIIFDAHNDRGNVRDKYYNWNMIDYIERYISSGILLGYRYQSEEMPLSNKLLYLNDMEMLNMENVKRKIRKEIKERQFIYISIDLDVMNPVEFPGVGYPVAGGITLVQLLICIREIFECTSARIIVDIVEYNPIMEKEVSNNVLERLINEILRMSERKKK